MELTYLGHAGFCVETEDFVLIMDPWLSPMGAFDASWFQFPCNHHLAPLLHDKLENTDKQRYIYISHEHKDHFDPVFLSSLQTSDFTFVIPHHRREKLFQSLLQIPCQEIVRCKDGESLALPNGRLTIYVDDSELDRDSAIVVTANGKTLLNLNDCKVHDRISEISGRHGVIDVFTSQFSGASWHPVCYDYPKKRYEAISMRKVRSKYESVARCIESTRPRVYLTSAGPACFLDPVLQHLNYEPVNIFPRGSHFLKFLAKRLPSTTTQFVEPMPGDTYDLSSDQWTYLSPERVTEDNFAEYMRAYEQRYEPFFRARRRQGNCIDVDVILSRLSKALRQKLDQLTLRDRIRIPLYFRLTDAPTRMLRVDFQQNVISEASTISERRHYAIETPSWEVLRVLDGRLSWEDYTLTFRMRLYREPDVYHTVIHGFLMMDPEDMNWFCAKVLDSESNTERALVEADGKRYSIHRYCPHQGADLTQGWIEGGRHLVCPRHRWKYDLRDGGQCTSCDVSIHAFQTEDN